MTGNGGCLHIYIYIYIWPLDPKNWVEVFEVRRRHICENLDDHAQVAALHDITTDVLELSQSRVSGLIHCGGIRRRGLRTESC